MRNILSGLAGLAMLPLSLGLSAPAAHAAGDTASGSIIVGFDTVKLKRAYALKVPDEDDDTKLRTLVILAPFDVPVDALTPRGYPEFLKKQAQPSYVFDADQSDADHLVGRDYHHGDEDSLSSSTGPGFSRAPGAANRIAGTVTFSPDVIAHFDVALTVPADPAKGLAAGAAKVSLVMGGAHTALTSAQVFVIPEDESDAGTRYLVLSPAPIPADSLKEFRVSEFLDRAGQSGVMVNLSKSGLKSITLNFIGKGGGLSANAFGSPNSGVTLSKQDADVVAGALRYSDDSGISLDGPFRATVTHPPKPLAQLTGAAAAAHPAALMLRKCQQAEAKGDIAQMEALSTPASVAEIEKAKADPHFAESLAAGKPWAEQQLKQPIISVSDYGGHAKITFGDKTHSTHETLIKGADGYKCGQ